MDRGLLLRIAAVVTIAGFVVISRPGWAQADVAVTMTEDRPKAKIGEVVVYRALVTNLGPFGATGVNLTFLLPDQFDPVSLICAGTPRPLSNGLNCGIGSLASGASVESIFVAKVVNTLSGPSGKFASVQTLVSSTTPDPNGSDNTAEVSIVIK